jgi:hypothetical protein
MNKYLLAIAALLAFDTAGFACTCLPYENPAKELEQSAAVFSGKVLDVRRSPKGAGLFTRVEAVFEVERAWKGVGERTISVFTSSQSSACGYGFKKGEAYLVYGSKDGEGRLITSICSRTRRLKDAGDDVKELGEGRAVGDAR